MSLLTPPGYKGYDTNAALMQLAKLTPKDDGSKIPSVLVLDEIDKAMRRAKDASWLQQLQFSLLPVLGGERLNLSDENGILPDRSYFTHHTLVLMMGVFPEIPARVWRDHDSARIALTKYGFCEEFVSRLTHIIPLEKLDLAEVRDLLRRGEQHFLLLHLEVLHPHAYFN